MKSHLSFEPTIYFLLDVLNINKGPLNTFINENLLIISRLAKYLGIYHYLIAWLISEPDIILQKKYRRQFTQELLKNKTRNILLKMQIIKLAKEFNKVQIPHIFLKGSAGLIRNLYDIECRYLSDIDILVPENQIDRTIKLLISLGYNPENNIVPSTHHHLEPYYHSNYPSEIEIHREPYGLSMLDRPAMPQLWHDADKILIEGECLLVPSITDHIWIIIRSEAINGALIPKLKETIEISQIIFNNYSFDIKLLVERAKQENIPNIIVAYSFACEKYFGIEHFVPVEENMIKNWYVWSLKQQRTILRNNLYKASRSRFGALTFLLSGGITQKIKYIKWLSRYEALENTEIHKIPFVFCKMWRISKDIALYFIFYIDYLWFQVTTGSIK